MAQSASRLRKMAQVREKAISNWAKSPQKKDDSGEDDHIILLSVVIIQQIEV